MDRRCCQGLVCGINGTLGGRSRLQRRPIETPKSYRPVMAKHDVTIDLPTRFVLHSDVTFAVWSDEAKLGELQVSKGSIDWLPGNGRTRYRMRWEKFNDLMREEGRATAR
jgi:hypothetical protein